MIMRVHCKRNVVKSIRKGWSSSIDVLQGSGIIKIIRNWPSLHKVTSTVHRKMYMGLYTHVRDTCIFISHRPIDKLIYQIYQLVGGFPAKFLSSCIIQNISFHIIGNKSFHFIFEIGAFPILVFTFKQKNNFSNSFSFSWLSKSKASKKEKNMALLMDIETRGPRAFISLVESLIEANQEHLARLLGYSASGPSQGQMGQAQATTPHDNRPGPFGQPTKPAPPGE